MRIVLAGTGSAVGKTTISTGIMKALSKKHNIQPFKVGPDYIDPSYHSLATGNTSRNLDSFFMSEDQIRTIFNRGLEKSNSKIAIIEGVRGLYEGISSINDVGSTASIAKALNSPIILIMDARSLVKSAAAIVLGFKKFDPDVRIEGVILNKVKGERHYLKAKKAIEDLTDTKVIGGIPRNDDIAVNERHLGLVPAIEQEKIATDIEKWGEVVEEYIDLDTLIEIMKDSKKVKDGKSELWKVSNKKPLKVGVAIDEVFNFYYAENIESLEDNKAKVIPFSPYKDEEVPDVDGLYIGGGYPEIFKKELESNESMLKSIKKFARDNNPIYGECGGLLYLSKAIDGFKMTNVFPYDSMMTKKVQGLSYVIAESLEDSLIADKGDIFRGHEFHYSKVEINPKEPRQKFQRGLEPNLAFKVLRGTGIANKKDGVFVNKTLANFIHIHACSCPNFAYNFTKNIVEP